MGQQNAPRRREGVGRVGRDENLGNVSSGQMKPIWEMDYHCNIHSVNGTAY